MILWTLLAACTATTEKDSGDGAGGCAAGEACVEIGNGETAHTPLADGDHVVMVHGPQGGWHVWGSLKTTNMSDIVSIHYTIDVKDTGARVSDNNYNVQMVASGTDYVYYGLFGFLNADDPATSDVVETPPDVLAGKTFTMCMSVTDANDSTRTAEDCVDVVADPDPCDLDDSCVEDTGATG